MGTPAAQGDGPREHVQSAQAGKPPEAEGATGAPGSRGGAGGPGSGRRPPLGSAASLPPPPSRPWPPRGRRAPSRPQPARPPAPAGGGPGHGAPRGPRTTGAPQAHAQRRPAAHPPCPAGGAFGKLGRGPGASQAASSARAGGQQGGRQSTGSAAGRGALPGKGRPGEPLAPRPAASPRRRVCDVLRSGQSAPAAGPVVTSRCGQVSHRAAAAAATTVPGRERAAGGAQARPPPRASAALQRGQAGQQAKGCPPAPQGGGLPERSLPAVKWAPAVGRGSKIQPRPERLCSAAHGALDRPGRTQRTTALQKLTRTPQPPQSRCHTGGFGCCTPKAATGALRCGGGAPKSRQRPAMVGAGREPQTPRQAQDRRQLLEQWVISRGRSYKRPPMTLPAKRPRKEKEALEPPSGGGLEEEEDRREQRSLTDKITSLLTECQELAEEGVPSEELLAMLSRIPEAEKFAQFWICKAKLLARRGAWDVTRLYEAAVCAGAAPIQELRDVVTDILRRGCQTATQATPSGASLLPHGGRATKSVQGALQGPAAVKPLSAVKLQVAPLLRVKEASMGPGLKILTPVRRSLRIEHALARYPRMLKDHDPVVSSLEELMATESEGQFVFRPNGALPGEGAVALLGL